MATFLGLCASASGTCYDDELDESIRKPIRRLHPERQFDQEMKKLRDEKLAKEKEEEEKNSLKSSKRKGKTDDRVVVGTRQQPASTADKTLMRELLSKDYSLTKYYEYEGPQPLTWKDEPVVTDVAPLLSSVQATRKGGVTVYAPEDVTMRQDANEVFFAFESDGSHATSALRLCVNYYADDPLNYTDIQFTIDGFNYNFRASNPSRGTMGAGMYWEQSSDALTESDKDLVYALSHCHWARMLLKGGNGINHVKKRTQSQLDAFASTFELYRAMGGAF